MTNGAYQVSDLRQAIRGILTGVNTQNVIDFYGKCQRAAVTLLMKANVPEMSDRSAMDFYDGVYDYTPAANMFGTLIQDVRPQGVSRDALDYPYKKPLLDFDMMKQRLSNGTLVTFEQRGIRKIMRVAQTLALPRVIIDNMTDTTGWVTGGNASGLAQDTTVFYDSPASLRFNLTANGSLGYIEKTAIPSADLSSYAGVGVAFLATRLPSVTAITSIELRLGSSSANYWDLSQTQGFLGAWIINDFLLTAFDLAAVSTVGTVNAAAITYARLSFAYGSTVQISNVRVGGLWVSLPTPYEVLFETPAIFVPTGSTTPQKTISSDNDAITLGDAAFTIYANECARAVAKGKGGTAASGLIGGIDLELEGNGSTKLGLYQIFRGDNPSDTLRSTGSWYQFRSY